MLPNLAISSFVVTVSESCINNHPVIISVNQWKIKWPEVGLLRVIFWHTRTVFKTGRLNVPNCILQLITLSPTTVMGREQLCVFRHTVWRLKLRLKTTFCGTRRPFALFTVYRHVSSPLPSSSLSCPPLTVTKCLTNALQLNQSSQCASCDRLLLGPDRPGCWPCRWWSCVQAKFLAWGCFDATTISCK